jgi:tRNA(fMet)-specific endonuclease VapC
VYTISSITRYEVLKGLRASGATTKLRFFEQFCLQNEVLPLTEDILVRAADVYGDLHRRGALINDPDILIAATALVHGLVLITNNQKHFSRITGLQIDNWTK